MSSPGDTSSQEGEAGTRASPPTRPCPNLSPPIWHLVSSSMQDRVVGTLVGSALGDAIGLYTEFLDAETSRKSYPSRTFVLHPQDDVTPFHRDMHRLKHLHGDWTDDTDHALLILLSFLHSNGTKLDPLDFAVRLKTWVKMGVRALDSLPLGLGATVGRTVRRADFLRRPTEIAREVWINGDRNLAPNGSLMRTHPLGLMCLTKSIEETFEVAASYSVITHADPRCIVACAIGTALVRGLVLGEVTGVKHLDGMLDAGMTWYERWNKSKGEEDASFQEDPPLDLTEFDKYAHAPSLPALELDERTSIGYVYKTFGSGVLLLRLSLLQMERDDWNIQTQLVIFEELITELIMQGGDADTNACFAGALLGALIGYKVLPPSWRDGLRHGKWLVGKAHNLCQVLKIRDGAYDGREDNDTLLDGGRGFLTDDQMEERWMLLQARMAKEESEHKKKQAPESSMLGRLRRGFDRS